MSRGSERARNHCAEERSDIKRDDDAKDSVCCAVTTRVDRERDQQTPSLDKSKSGSRDGAAFVVDKG